MFKGIAGQIALGFVGCTIFAVAATSGIALWNARTSEEATLSNNATTVQQVLDEALNAEADRALSMAVLVSETQAAAEALANRDRDALAAMYQGGFAALRADHGVAQFQFHLAPATSFYRVHRPDRFDDDLSSFRHTVVAVNTNGAPQHGLEVGVAGLGMRGVVPVHHDGQQVGSVEFGLSFGDGFFERFTARTGELGALYLARDGAFERFAGTLPDMDAIDADLLEAGQREALELPGITIDDTQYLLRFFPVRDYSGEAIGTAVVALDTEFTSATMNTALAMIVAGAVLCLLVAVAIATRFHRILGRRLRDIAAAMARLSRGDLDVELPPVRRDDEIGLMEQSLTTFHGNASAVAKNTEERAQAEAKVERERRATLMGMLHQLVNLSVDTNEVEIRVARMLHDTHLSEREVATVAAAIEEMRQSIAGIADTSTSANDQAQNCEKVADGGRTLATEASAAIDDISDAVNAAEAEVSGLVEASQQIGSIVEQIEAIAGQTNLLALNATIEAARAGEVGKGFAVVASEVKSLAQQTGRATEDIRGRIDNVRDKIDHILSAVERSTGAVTHGNEVIAELGNALAQIGDGNVTMATNMSEIAGGLTQQSAASNEIAQSSSTLSDVVQRNSSSIGDIFDALTNLASVLETQVGSFADLGTRAVLEIARNDHSVFKKHILDTVIGRSSLKADDVPDCHQCRLGQWYDNADEECRSHPLYKKLKEPHERVHDIGKDVLRLVHRNDMAAALARVDDLNQASSEVLEILQQMAEEFRAREESAAA